MMHVGDIMSTVGVFSSMGKVLLFGYPHGTEHPPLYLCIPHGTEHPTVLHTPRYCTHVIHGVPVFWVFTVHRIL